MDATVIISTYPNRKSILKIANHVIKKQIAACVNFTKIYSVYTWQGKLENTEEFLAFFKTTSRKKVILKKEIKKSHPYKIPEIMEIKITAVNKSYLGWLVNSTN